ncbi:MAG: 5-formyltetrahydrofolate cyclo-ligase [Clostridiaceae bacterium]
MNFKDKNEIRKLILNKRNNLTTETKKKWDTSIYNKLTTNIQFTNANTIFTYVNFNNEIDTLKIIDVALKSNKTLCVPKVNKIDKEISAYSINSTADLEKGYFGILEPKNSCPLVSKENIDLILLPGLAFDINGNRIGYGGGFYDKYLEDLNENTYKIALSYEFQILESIPFDHFDKKANEIITNKKTILIY